MREETRCRPIGYSFWLAAMVLIYASSHRQDNTYHGLCYTSRGALARMRNSSMHPPHEGSIRRPIAPWANALTTEQVRTEKLTACYTWNKNCTQVRTEKLTACYTWNKNCTQVRTEKLTACYTWTKNCTQVRTEKLTACYTWTKNCTQVRTEKLTACYTWNKNCAAT